MPSVSQCCFPHVVVVPWPRTGLTADTSVGPGTIRRPRAATGNCARTPRRDTPHGHAQGAAHTCLHPPLPLGECNHMMSPPQTLMADHLYAPHVARKALEAAKCFERCPYFLITAFVPGFSILCHRNDLHFVPSFLIPNLSIHPQHGPGPFEAEGNYPLSLSPQCKARRCMAACEEQPCWAAAAGPDAPRVYTACGQGGGCTAGQGRGR